jgi:hypothetical protein
MVNEVASNSLFGRQRWKRDFNIIMDIRELKRIRVDIVCTGELQNLNKICSGLLYISLTTLKIKH